MSSETLKAVAELIKALTWVVGVLGAFVLLYYALRRKIPLRFKHGDSELVIVAEPGQKATPPPRDVREKTIATFGADVAGAPTTGKPAFDSASDLPPLPPDAALPSDYLYLIHTSFLRPNKQAEFQARTRVPVPHYDIRVKLDSYYAGALDRVRTVEYLLHKSFPHPVQSRYDRADGFLLKELANGEFVLTAKVYLRDRHEPLVLQRYITLWPEGPRID
jgi:hypothetical protein